MNLEKVKIENVEFFLNKPDTCYHCEKGIDPKIVNKFIYRYWQCYNIVITYQCPCCDEIFFAFYQIALDSYDGIIDRGTLYPFKIVGGNKISKTFSDEINDLSQGFVLNYNDSFKAEQSGCTEIVGLGYRRAFEFLIKDFALKYFPGDKDKIIYMPLSQCVEKYSPDDETKQLLLRTSWIGNDYTHYNNKHEDVTLEDLKQLIMLSVNDIESFIKKKNYIVKIEKK